MNARWTVGLAGALVAILLLARLAGGERGLDLRALGIRVAPGEGVRVPTSLATEMQAWPPVAQSTPDEVELGRLLFFDPILSKNNQISCATCHHPDLGLSDGRALSIGVSGVALRRSAPALWNVALRPHLTWDGRAVSLQNQMLDGPLFHPDELAETPEALLAELQANAEYQERFGALYQEVTLPRMAEAIAAFQRTLLSQDAPFDRFAAGDWYALTGAQRRGWEIFRSPEVNCIACHKLPTFSNPEFKVIGVGDGALPFDPGRGGITERAEDVGAFAVPTLRNVALTAPYMHNGIEPTLNGVISFYLNGGGDNVNIPPFHLDSDLRPFNLPTRDLRDLEAFLLSLTDEGGRPAIPTSVPSGGPVVSPQPNPARERVAAAAALSPGTPRTHRVVPGDSIQAALDLARPGDTLLIEPGTYYEALDIDVDALTLRGEGVLLQGRAFTPTGVTVRNNNVTLIGLTLADFPDWNLDLHGAHTLRLEGVTLNGQSVTTTLAP